MKNGINHTAHILKCFQSYGFFVYQCSDIFQRFKGIIAIRKNVSILANVCEIKGSEFDIKHDSDKEKIETLDLYSNKATCGLVIYSQENDCYYWLPIELIVKAIEMKVRFITLNTLYSVAMEMWRNM